MQPSCSSSALEVLIYVSTSTFSTFSQLAPTFQEELR